jgi:DNA-binding response OmpR family regulator
VTPQLLIVEDDTDLRDSLTTLLGNEGYVVRGVQDGMQALKLIEQTEPDLVLLDLGLPTLKGEMVCKEIKKNYPEIAVIILTGRDSTSDIVEGLNLGADDYLTKPFDYDELVARIKARLRSVHGSNEKLSAADLTLDLKTFQVTRGTQNISLTPQEFRILEYLLTNKGRVLSREMILGRLWKGNPDIETRVIDVYIGYLRKKIDKDFPVKLIQSVRGFGYKIEDTAP